MKQSRLAISLAVVSAVFFGASLTAQRAWVEVKSPHFIVASDDGEKSARDIAWQFEQIRAGIQTVWSWARVDFDRPVLVLVARDENSMKALAPQFWEERGGVRPGSVSANGSDRHYIAVRGDAKAVDTAGVNAYVNAYWAYTSVVLATGSRRELPLWFSRGLADVMSNTIVRESFVQVGQPIPWHVQRLRSGGERLRLRELITLDRNSPWVTDGARRPVWDAQCWALMHYLMFADDGAHRSQLDRFVTLLGEGKAAPDAATLAFGDLDAIDKGVNLYIKQELFGYVQIKADLNVKREGFATRVLSPAEAAATRAAFHAAMRRPVEARALIDEARKLDPNLPAPYEVAGILADAERKTEDARAAYAKAAELGSTNFYAYHRWAVLMGRPADAEGRAQVERSFTRAVELNSSYMPSHALLADVKTQLGHPDEALVLAARAVSLEPGRTQGRLALARALAAASRFAEAQKEAREGLAVAVSDIEKTNAQQLIDRLDRQAPAAAR